MADYYVSKTGNDGNPGTTGSPKLTIAAGAALLASGDTLYIGDGTYEETMANIIPSGTLGSPTRVRAETALMTIIKPNAPSGFYVLSITTTTSYITFDGLVFDGLNTQSYPVYISASSGTIHDIIIQNGEMRNSQNEPVDGVPNGAFGAGILIGHHSNVGGHYNNQILNCLVHDNEEHGIYLACTDALVEGCDVYDCGLAGNHTDYILHLYSGSYGVNDNIIRKCKFHGGADFGCLISSGSGTQFYNNIIYGNGTYGIMLNYGAVNAEIYNNTIYNNGSFAIQGQDSFGCVAQNNIFYNNGSDSINEVVGTISDSNNLTGADPKFEDAANGDFHILSTSPAINTGVQKNSVFTDDYDGWIRGSTWDIGAFEFKDTPPTEFNLMGACLNE